MFLPCPLRRNTEVCVRSTGLTLLFVRLMSSVFSFCVQLWLVSASLGFDWISSLFRSKVLRENGVGRLGGWARILLLFVSILWGLRSAWMTSLFTTRFTGRYWAFPDLLEANRIGCFGRLYIIFCRFPQYRSCRLKVCFGL